MSDKYRIDPNVRTHGIGTGAKLTEWDQLRAENERLEREWAADRLDRQAAYSRLQAENERLRAAIQPLLEAGAPYQDEQGGCNYCGGGDWQPALKEHNDECVWLHLYRAFRAGRAEAIPCEGECNHALHV